MAPQTVNFTGFDTLTPGSANTDTLIGEDVASTWTLGASSITYYDGTKALTIPSPAPNSRPSRPAEPATRSTSPGPSQARSRAAHGHDVFNLMSGGSVTGGIHGESGDSTINYYAAANVTIYRFRQYRLQRN